MNDSDKEILQLKNLILASKMKMKSLMQWLYPAELTFMLLQMEKVKLLIKMLIKNLMVKLMREVTLNKRVLQISRRAVSNQIHIKIINWKERFGNNFLKKSSQFMFNEFALKIDILIELLVSPTNLYAKQNERNFVTKKKGFLSG